MFKNKLVRNIFICLFAASLALNLYYFNKNEDYKIGLGSQYQGIINGALFELSDGEVDFWIKILKEEEEGDIWLENHINGLQVSSHEFHMIGGKISSIGILLDALAEDYYDLKEKIRSESDLVEQKQAMTEKIDFLRTLLIKIKTDLGESDKLWYKELSGRNTDTQTYVWEKFKEVEEKLGQ